MPQASSHAICQRWNQPRSDARLQQDINQELGDGLSATLTAGAGDCLLRLELSSFHLDLAYVVFSQQGGAALAFADGSDSTALQQSTLVPGHDVYGEREAVASAVSDTAAVATPAGRQRVSRQRQQAEAAAPGTCADGTRASLPQKPMEVGGSAPPLGQPPSLPSSSYDVAEAAAATGSAGDHLGAVLARARALMARTYEQEQQEQQQEAGASNERSA